LTLCLAAVAAQADITAEQVAGRQLVSKAGTFVVAPDGRLTGTVGKGEALKGSWSVRDGQWCRKITAPKSLAGSECQPASIKGRTLTLTRKDGTKVAFEIR
jgi:hypothetical protein